MEEFYLSILNNLRDGIYFVDTSRKILFWNKAAEQITGYSAEEMTGKDCPNSKLNHIDEEGRPLCIVGCPLHSTIIEDKPHSGRVFVRHKDGYRIPVHTNMLPMKKDGKIIGAVEIFTQDSSTVYEDDLVEKLSAIAMHDALTGIPNRRYAESFLKFKFDEYKRFGHKFAVLFADIDNFGSFNNNYGHDVGDLVLVNIAKSLKNSIRHSDFVGRWGGEEFVGIFSVANDADIEIIGEKFRQMVHNTEITVGDKELSVSVSVGITLVRDDDTASTVVERADMLMYKSKKNGKNRVSVD